MEVPKPDEPRCHVRLNLLRMFQMGLHPEDWVTLKNGKKYKGELGANCRPDGFGILQEDETSFYVGELQNGWKHGRGFMLHFEKWSEKRMVWQKGTYEEIMSTAEFDSCGRVIHVDNVGKYVPQEVNCERWYLTEDGMWNADEFKSEISRYILRSRQWDGAETYYTRYEFYRNARFNDPTHFAKSVSEVHADGQYSFNREAIITPYDRTSLLVCDFNGNVCRLEAGKEALFLMGHHTHSDEYLGYTFSLGTDYKMHIDLMVGDWKEQVPPLAKAHLYSRALGSLIMRCKMLRRRPDLEEYNVVLQAVQGDEWTIEEDQLNTWLMSAKAGVRYRITCVDPDLLAAVAPQAKDILDYIDSKLSSDGAK